MGNKHHDTYQLSCCKSQGRRTGTPKKEKRLWTQSKDAKQGIFVKHAHQHTTQLQSASPAFPVVYQPCAGDLSSTSHAQAIPSSIFIPIIAIKCSTHTRQGHSPDDPLKVPEMQGKHVEVPGARTQRESRPNVPSCEFRGHPDIKYAACPALPLADCTDSASLGQAVSCLSLIPPLAFSWPQQSSLLLLTLDIPQRNTTTEPASKSAVPVSRECSAASEHVRVRES
jgi:hypothetical protein